MWTVRKRSKVLGCDMMRNNNASRRRRRRRSRKKKRRRNSSRSKRRRGRRSRSRRRGRRSRRRRRKRSKSSDKTKHAPIVTINPVPQIIEPTPTTTTTDEKQTNPTQTIVGRRRLKPGHIVRKKPFDHCLNYDQLRSSLFQAALQVDSMKNLLPCDENDRAKLSTYEYELNYDEEHLFRC